MTHEYIGTKQVTAWPEDKDGKAGYGIKYADGYISWSPKDVFEASYIDIGHVSQLPPHQQRVIGEKAVLDKNANALSQFIANSATFLNLDPAEQERMKEQNEIMWQLSEILGKRIEAFR